VACKAVACKARLEVENVMKSSANSTTG